jgi:hypothetical protein
MYKSLSLLALALLFSLTSYCQVKETIDQDISLINYVPYGKFDTDDWKQKERENQKFRRTNPEYQEILALDTAAIPYLVNKISDTTETIIRVPCATRYLKAGDVAFALLNDIILIPWHAVTGSQWDSYSCDPLPDGGWAYLDHNRLQFQAQLKAFFASPKGKLWVRVFKDKKLKKAARAELAKRFQQLPITPYSEDTSLGNM